MTSRKAAIAVSTALPTLLFSSGAWANSMPIGLSIPTGFFDRVALLVGFYGILVSIAMGVGGLYVAKKVQLDSSRKVFARGFLGVAAVVCFACSVGLIAAGTPAHGKSSPALGVVAALIPLVLGVEFAIAGALYMAVHEKKGGAGSMALSIVSYGVAVVSALVTVALLGQQLEFTLGGYVVPSVLLASAAAPVALSVRSFRRAVPETVADVMKWGLWGWAAFGLVFVGGVWIGSDKTKDEGTKDAAMLVAMGLGPLVLAAQAGLSTWLLRRRWLARKDKLALAMAVLVGVGGGLAALWCLAVALGSLGGGPAK